MKKVLSILIAVLLIVAIAVPATATRNLTYVAPKATPSVDGLVEALWDSAQWTNVDLPHDGTADTDSTMKVKLLWDEQTLYFLSEVYDSDLNKANDLIEFYLDEGMQRSKEYDGDDSHTRFCIFDGKKDTQGKNCKEETSCVSKANGKNKYLLEGSIKLAKPVSEGGSIGLEFMYNDGGANSDFLQAYRWNVDSAGGDDLPFRNASVFGTLTFGAPAKVEEEPKEETPTSKPEGGNEKEETDNKQEEVVTSTNSTPTKDENAENKPTSSVNSTESTNSKVDSSTTETEEDEEDEEEDSDVTTGIISSVISDSEGDNESQNNDSDSGDNTTIYIVIAALAVAIIAAAVVLVIVIKKRK